MRKISLILLFVFVVTCFPANTLAIIDEWYPEGAPHEIPLEDTAKMSDEEFFGVWEDDGYSVIGKINYEFTPDESDLSYKPLKAVENYVKNQDYEGAKRELLQYYRDKGITKKELSGRNTVAANMALKWTFFFRDNYVSTFSVDNEPSIKEVDVTWFVQNSRENFMLAGADKGNSIAYFNTKENPDGNAPVLEVVVNGETRSYTPAADTYVDFGNRGVVQGNRFEMRVCDSGLDVNRPFDDTNTRAYIRFDIFANPDPEMRINEDDVVSSATLKLYGYTNDTSGSKRIALFDPENKNFDETVMTWDTTPVCLISWEGIPGGTDWADHQMDYNAHNQLANSTVRLPVVEQLLAEYYATYDDKYLKGAFGLLVDFCADYGSPGYIIPISVGERCSVWDTIYPYLLESSYMTPDINVMLLKQIWIDTDYLNEEGNFFSFNNHGVVQTKGFLKMCVQFPEFSNVSDIWLPKVQERVDELTGNMVLEDGFYVESDTGYAVTVLQMFLEYAEISAESGVMLSDEFYVQLGNLGLSLLDCCWPDGTIQSLGDGGVGDVRSLYKELGTLFSGLDDELFVNWGEQFLYFGTDGASGSPVEHESFYYEKARIGIMRRGWGKNDSLFAMINGGHEGGHNHRDKLHIDIYAYGKPLIKDTGMASYSDLNPAYDYQKNTSRSHNVIEIDHYRAWDGAIDKVNVEMDSSMTVNNMYDFFSGQHNLNSLVSSSMTKFITERNVLFIKHLGFYIVSDHVTPPDNEEHYYTQNWHLEPNIAAIKEDGTKRTYSNFSSGANIQIVPGNPDEVDVLLADGYGINGSIQPLAVLDKHPQYIKQQSGPVSFDTILFPTREGDMRDVVSKPLTLSVPLSIATAFEFDTNYPKQGEIGSYFFRYTDDDSKISYGEYSTDAMMSLVMKYPTGNITSMVLHGGSVLNSKQENGEEVKLINSESEVSDLGILFYGTTMEISSSQNLESQEISIYAPSKIKNVFFNGQQISFVSEDDYIIINKSGTDVETTYNESKDLYEGNVSSEGIKKETIAGNAEVELLIQGNSKLEGKNWNGIIDMVAAESNESVNIEIRKNNEEIYSDKTVKIEVTGIDISSVSMNGKTLSKVSYSGIEEADQRLEKNDAKYQLTDSGVIIWTKTLSEFNLAIKTKTSGSPNDYNGGTGGTGSNGGTGSDDKNDSTLPNEQGQKDENKENNESKKTFKDVEDHWAKAYIEELVARNLVNGINENEFLPDNNVTRAEFSALIVRCLEKEVGLYKDSFSDVKHSDWFAGYVQTMYELSIAEGFNGCFRPNDNITREEMAKMLIQAYNTVSLRSNSFKEMNFIDFDNISDWAEESVSLCLGLELLQGNDKNEFLPKNYATRAEAATVIFRLFKLINSEV